MAKKKPKKIKKAGKPKPKTQPGKVKKIAEPKQSKKPKTILQTPTGMSDILPQDHPYFDKVLRIAESFSNFYGFEKIKYAFK